MLHHKSVDSLAKIQIYTAIRTSVTLFSPLGNAFITAKLIALLAFLGIFDNKHANGTGEVTIELGDSLIRI